MTTSPIDPLRKAGLQPSVWCLLGSLYTTQSVALMFFMGAFVAIIREKGATFEQISLVYLVGMVWPLKCLWAPLVDRFRIGRLGHYRGWLMLMQAGMVAALAVAASLDEARDFTRIYALCVLIAFLSATQDIAVDGLACRILSSAQRGLANGVQIAGGLLGNLLGAGAALVVYHYAGWRVSLYWLAAITGISLVQLLFYREPVTQAQIRRALALGRFVTFWRQPGGLRWLLLLMFYTVSSSLAYALIMPMLVDAGWSLSRIGLVVNVFGSLAGVIAAVGCGVLLRGRRRRHALILAAIVQVVGVAAVAVPLLAQPTGFVLTAMVGVYFFCYNPAAVVLATVMMDRTSSGSPATDYTLQFSVNQCFALGMVSIGAALAAPLGYPGVTALAMAAAWLAVALAVAYRESSGGNAGEVEGAKRTESTESTGMAEGVA
ncbi:MFS transporter [Pandoraea sp. ISTKB]|uniref:MFS transporter n=1 Tax=Pandoraea sp. ISTKB TaxID=1586708 RepID=UPI0008473979|nr:MFS transporter [Pandoraea sp. ISTKB]ODP31675.1 hypothetical protein A9762_06780 [Pandoraea sp. ISTKB]